MIWMKPKSEKERLLFLRQIWAQGTDVFNYQDIANSMIHDFIGFAYDETSLKALDVGQYEGVISWLKWCDARMDVLGYNDVLDELRTEAT